MARSPAISKTDITGNCAEVQAMIDRLGGLKKANKLIAKAAMPKIEALIAGEFASGAGPYDVPWIPKKDGGQPFQSSSDKERVKLRLIGLGSTIRATPAYPMVFHQDGKQSHGRKRVREQRKRLRAAGYQGRELRDHVLHSVLPPRIQIVEGPPLRQLPA